MPDSTPATAAQPLPHDVVMLAIEQEIERANRSNYNPGRIDAGDLASVALTALAANGYTLRSDR